MWRGASRVAIQCLVQSPSGVDQAFQRAICDRVRAVASRGAPIPVNVIAQGDPAVL